MPTMKKSMDDQDCSEEQLHLRDAYIINHAVRRGAILVRFCSAVQPSPPLSNLLCWLSCIVVQMHLACSETIVTDISPVCGHVRQSSAGRLKQALSLRAKHYIVVKHSVTSRGNTSSEQGTLRKGEDDIPSLLIDSMLAVGRNLECHVMQVTADSRAIACPSVETCWDVLCSA